MISRLFIELLKMASSKLMLILRKTWQRWQELPSLTSTYIQTLLAKSINVNMLCQAFSLAVARLSSVLPAPVPRSLPTSKTGLCHKGSPVVAACVSSRPFNKIGAVVEALYASTKAWRMTTRLMKMISMVRLTLRWQTSNQVSPWLTKGRCRARSMTFIQN